MLEVKDKNNNTTLKVDDKGNVIINCKELKIQGGVK